MGLAKPLHLRLFLEGQEVPVISAAISVNLFAPATAAIQVVPLPEALQLKPRTMVHLFFLEEPLLSNGGAGRVSLSQLRSADGSDTPLSDTAYKLLFCGEFAGFSFVKTPMSRGVVLQCVDHSSYWDFLYATMLEYGANGNVFTHRASLYASNQALFSDLPTQTEAEKLRSWIFSKPKTPGLENVGGLAGGVISIMEIMGGLRNHTLGVNDFFTLAELRCHLLSQVTAEDGDSTAQRLLDSQVFWEFIFNNLQNQSGLITLRDLFKLLCSYIYYCIVPNPVAKFDQSVKNRTVKVPASITKLVTAREFPAVLGKVQASVGTLSQITVTEVQAKKTLADYDGIVLPKLNNMTGIPASVVSRAQKAQASLKTYVESFSKQTAAVVEKNREAALAACQTVAAELQDAADMDVTNAGYTAKVNDLSRLRTQIFRPDCYMAVPPTCNVIFPEQYSQMSYDRSLIDEVSRVDILAFNKLVGQDALLAAQFLVPNMWNASDGVAKNIGNKWRVLMDHELHTGIVAKEEWLSDNFSVRRPNSEGLKKVQDSTISWQQRAGMHHFFKYRVGPRTLNLAGRFMPYLAAGFPALVLQQPFYSTKLSHLAQKDAIDAIRQSQNAAEDFDAPPQFLGTIEGLSHTIDQEGGHTQVSMSHVRNHLGIDDEFVGLVLAKTKARGLATKTVRYHLSFSEAVKDEKKRNFLLNCTPQLIATDRQPIVDKQVSQSDASYVVKTVSGGVETVTTKTVSVKSTKEAQKSAAAAPATADSTKDGATIKIPQGGAPVCPGAQGLYGTVKLIEVLPPFATTEYNGDRYFQSILVYEDVAFGVGQSESVPFEYVVQPSWLSTSYDNEQIGKKIYQPFFGCDSIADQIALSTEGQIVERDPDGVLVLPGEEVKALKERLQKIEAQKGLIAVEKAVNVIAYLYGKVRSEHLDVDEFVESFVRRPVATKKDLLGSYDLELAVSGSSVKVTKGTAGFHTFSVHPSCVKAKNLTGLMDDPAIQLAHSISRSQMKAVQASYDVRWQKLEQVEKYRAKLAERRRGFTG